MSSCSTYDTRTWSLEHGLEPQSTIPYRVLARRALFVLVVVVEVVDVVEVDDVDVVVDVVVKGGRTQHFAVHFAGSKPL